MSTKRGGVPGRIRTCDLRIRNLMTNVEIIMEKAYMSHLCRVGRFFRAQRIDKRILVQHNATCYQPIREGFMSVRKRKWVMGSTGEEKEAWIVDYTDQQGDRHIETFARKKDAEARHDAVRGDVRQGIHTAPSKSITVAEAAEDWIAYVKLEGREQSTVAQYRQHVD